MISHTKMMVQRKRLHARQKKERRRLQIFGLTVARRQKRLDIILNKKCFLYVHLLFYSRDIFKTIEYESSPLVVPWYKDGIHIIAFNHHSMQPPPKII
mmetsp:Transcript_39532/g.81180  ORF Transcript_39532/g.81180 Transcript_39532/m.81180 type:complete len:98 (-) Transcript_39532:2915-3208(-)